MRFLSDVEIPARPQFRDGLHGTKVSNDADASGKLNRADILPVMMNVARSDRLTARSALVGSNHKTAALWNRALVLRLVRQHTTLSRRQIAQITGLRGSTLTYIVRELIEKGVLRTAGKLTSKAVGQKQVLLNVNPALGYLLGISLRPGVAQLILVDAAQNRLGRTTFPINGPLESLPVQLRAGVDRWLAKLGEPTGRLLSVGLGVPGIVSTADGMVLNSALFNANAVPLRALLAEQFPVTVQIDHDACFGALAEAGGGVAKDVSHFIYFSINYNRIDGEIRLNSFGSALFLDGRVYRGAHFASGELNSALSPRRDLLAAESDLTSLADPDAPLSTMLDTLAQTVATTLASIINFLDVQMVVVGGNCNITNTRFLQSLREQTESMMIPVPGRQIQIVGSQLKDEAVTRGAVIAAWDSALENGSILAEKNPTA